MVLAVAERNVAFSADQILAGVADPLMVINPCRIIQVVNKAACQLFESTEAVLIGTSIDSLKNTLFPQETVRTAFRTGKMQRYESFQMTKQGENRLLDVLLSAIRNKDGSVSGLVCMIRDITGRAVAGTKELQRAHAELRKSHEKLKTAQLHLIQAEKMDSVGRMAAGVAHEVKNPLAVILQGLNYLSKRLDSNNDDCLALNYMEDAARRADIVIRGLVDFSTSKSLELQPESINPIVEQSLMLVKHELDKNHIQIIKDLDDSLPFIPLDKNKITQVFVNLFVNAVQAMTESGMLSIKTSLVQLMKPGGPVGRRETDRFKIGEWAVLAEVEDTGTGIPPEILPKVFDPFFTTKPTGTGTGLGLTVTKGIVELHGGAIQVENRPEGGVRARLFLKTGGVTTDG